MEDINKQREQEVPNWIRLILKVQNSKKAHVHKC